MDSHERIKSVQLSDGWVYFNVHRPPRTWRSPLRRWAACAVVQKDDAERVILHRAAWNRKHALQLVRGLMRELASAS